MSNPRLVLFLTIFVAMLGLSVLFPVLAPLARELNLSVTQVGMFSTAYSLLQFLCAPYWGSRSERAGRKPILVIGLIGFTLSFALFALFATLGMNGVLSGTTLFITLLLTRVIGGAISSATLPSAQAYMADITDPENRAAGMGLIGAAFGLGIVFGPGLGALLSTYGLLAPVYFSIALGALTTLFAALTLRESRAPHVANTTPTPERRRDLLKRPALLFLLVISSLYTLASVAMEQTIGFFVQDTLHVTGISATRTIGLMLVVFGLLAAVVQGARPIFKRFTASRLIPTGLAIMGAGMLLITQFTTFWSITLALGLVAVGSALLGPSLTAALSLRAGAHEQGTVAGLNASALALGRVLGPLIGTFLYQHVNMQGPYVFSGVLLLAMLPVMLLAFRREEQRLAAASD